MYKDFLKHWLKLFKTYESPISTALGIFVVFGIIGITSVYVTSLRKTKFTPTSSPEPSISPSPSATPQVFQNLPQSVTMIEKNGEYHIQGLPALYIVQTGNTLPQIALAFYKSEDNQIDIQLANNIATGSALTLGQQLIVPDIATKLSREIIEREKSN